MWASDGRKQLVTECEILPQLIARRLWAKRLLDPTFVFVDSEPAKFGLIKGLSDTRSCYDSQYCFVGFRIHTLDLVLKSAILFNVADDPSKLLFDKSAEEFPEALLCDASSYIPLPSDFE